MDSTHEMRRRSRGRRLPRAAALRFLRWVVVAVAVVLVSGAVTAAPAAAKDRQAKVEDLNARHRQWLDDVRWLIPTKERKEFLRLTEDHQRDAFIRAFWAARDPYPETSRNEFREAWYNRLEHAEETYGNTNEDRARILLLQGPPDLAFEFECTVRMWPLEVWRYDEPEGIAGSIYTLFFQPGGSGPIRLWQGGRDGLAALFSETSSRINSECARDRVALPARGSFGDAEVSLQCASHIVRRRCSSDPGLAEAVADAMARAVVEDHLANYSLLLTQLEKRPKPREEEWLATFHSYSTELPDGAETFEVSPSFAFPRREGGRTVVRTELEVPEAAVQSVELAGRRSYDFSLTGEVLRYGELFESFRYRFDAPQADSDGMLSLIFQRLLRPGEFQLVLKLEDLHGGGFWRGELDLAVPEAADPPVASDPAPGSSLAGLLAPGGGPELTRVELSGPDDEFVVGMARFDAQVTGEAARVTFFLDGRQVMTKARLPFSLELDLGRVPRPHTVRAVAFDRQGRRIGLDELDLNTGEHRFAVRLLTPRSGEARVGPTEVQVELAVPTGKELERLELFVGEEQTATLFQEPFLHVVDLPSEPGYVRAVAYLDDGASREAVAFVNLTDPIDEIQVKLVEIYASVLAQGRPVPGLSREAFQVLEDGVEQEVVRFEQVSDRPVHLVLMVDSSASMEERIDTVRTAAAGFFDRMLTPKDRAAVVPFSDRTVREVDLSSELGELTLNLATLKAERGTALYDNLVSVLYNLNGMQGQRAIVLLSDGEDRSSTFTFAEARDFARAAGVAIYPIGIDLSRARIATRRELSLLASESGGRAFFVDDVGELDEVYAAIESELRTKYLLVYQSSGSGSAFRQVEVSVEERGAEVKAMRGYYP